LLFGHGVLLQLGGKGSTRLITLVLVDTNKLFVEI
jgi:hypothetical protein